MPDLYKNIVQFQNSTVAVKYEPIAKNSTAYESERQMEDHLISQLKAQGYGTPDIHSEADLIANLRNQLERLNRITFSDAEWKRFFDTELAKATDGIVEKTKMVQDRDTAIIFRFDDGTDRNIRLLDKMDVPRNYLQVIHQYLSEGDSHSNRYDITILVNGLPMVHIELKRRGRNIRDAFDQISRYGRESFWAGSSLYEYVQLFVISNGTYTKYYSNTTRMRKVEEAQKGQNGSRYTTSNSFEFTSYWADVENRIIPDIQDFTATFLCPNTILNILMKYCVLTMENTLMVMRPYQIAATEVIMQRIIKSVNYREWGTIKGGGYIWHTTGSGKTLTSFKTAQLLSQKEYIDKVLFVVDRKDLDYQTMKEYNRFEKDAVNGNKSTEALKRQLEDRGVGIIVTTIQKLSVFIKKHPEHEVYHKHVVIIIDECHRSQFGDMHKAIVRHFKRYHIFGFTGTPIFTENAPTVDGVIKTTEMYFGDKLHTYTIVNAIQDENVLPFKIDYIRTMKCSPEIEDEKIHDIDRGNALKAWERTANVTEYILKHYGQKTRQGKTYTFSKLMNISEVVGKKKALEEKETVRLTGFNSIFAVQNIPLAKAYYAEFKRQQESVPERSRLKVGLIYSYAPNEDTDDTNTPDENSESTSMLDQSSRDFLNDAIKNDYNRMFGTSYDVSDKEFENYYKDVSLRMKNRELDILIVVNMFLTGFDATTLGTLWVDKNLRMHGLLQAYSRTNRILNSVKKYGNIVCFRDLSANTDEAIARFGNKDSRGLVLLRTFDDYLHGYTDTKGHWHEGYIKTVGKLKEMFPDAGTRIIGENAEKEFITIFNTILRQRNILTSFDEFEENDPLDERTMQDYTSTYHNLHEKYRGYSETEKENINDDIVFEMELVKQVDVNIDYILFLVEKYRASGKADRKIVADIRRTVSASVSLRDKRYLIEEFIASINPDVESVVDEWLAFVRKRKEEELDGIIAVERLDPEKTRTFLDLCFRDGAVKETGTEIIAILPPMSMFNPDRGEKKAKVIERLKEFFEKYHDIMTY